MGVLSDRPYFHSEMMSHFQPCDSRRCPVTNTRLGDRPRGYKTFSMLNSPEHELFLFINVKMPTIIGIVTFMSEEIVVKAYLSLKKPNFLIFIYLRAFIISC